MPIQSIGTVPYSVAGFGNALTQDLANGNPAAQSFFPTKNWEAAARDIDRRDYPRQRLHTILSARARELNAAAAVIENIERLSKPGTYVVATGQQAGLFGGPLYSIYKALTAIKLAQKFEAESGGASRFVPVFWVASDDHDLAEIDHADLIEKSGVLRRVHAPLESHNSGRSACDEFIPDKEIEIGLNELRSVIGDDSMNSILEAYRGRSLSSAFAKLFTDWLGKFGLVVVEAHDMRVLARDVLLKEFSDYETTSKLIEGEAASLKVHGYTPGFSGTARPGPHFFITTEPAKIRARLEPSGAGTFHEHSPAFEAREENARNYSTEELRHLIHDHPERFSASAALRPIVQQTIFPVTTAVLGPGEIDYWAQLEKLHDHFDVPFPCVVPRATMTLIDGHVAKALRKLDVEPTSPEIFGDESTLKAKVLASSEISKTIEARTTTILSELDKLTAEVQAVDKGLNPLFQKARERFAGELARIKDKTAASIGQRGGANQARLQQISTWIRPKNQPQERVLNAGQFMTRYPALINELLEALNFDAREHFVVTIDE